MSIRWCVSSNNPGAGHVLFFAATVAFMVAATLAVGGGGRDRAHHQLVAVPVLQVGSSLSFSDGGHHGGGATVERRWSSSAERFVSSSSSSAFDERRWRLLKLVFFLEHGDGGRWPSFLSPLVTFLAERRPYLFLPAVEPSGRQCSVCMVSMASGYGSLVAPSGVVPR